MKYHECKIEDCNSVNLYKTVCDKHRYQLKKFGKPVKTAYDPRPAVIEGDIAKLPLGMNATEGYAIVDKKYSHLDKHN